jgi:hypothetical protein
MMQGGHTDTTTDDGDSDWAFVCVKSVKSDVCECELRVPAPPSDSEDAPMLLKKTRMAGGDGATNSSTVDWQKCWWWHCWPCDWD